MLVNMNVPIQAKLTEYGVRFLQDLGKQFPSEAPRLARIVEMQKVGGVVRLQLWEVAQIFGPTFFNGNDVVFEGNLIEVPDPGTLGSNGCVSRGSLT